MEYPLLTVLIPIYNVEKYLQQCLESIRNQTMRELCIICINDGSTDRCLEIIEKYVSEDNRFKLLNKKNSGYGDSLNQGLDLVRTKYVGIIEPDDYIEPTMFEKLYKCANEFDLDIARCKYSYHYEKDNSDSPNDNTYISGETVFSPRQNKFIFFQQPSLWANIYKKSFLDENKIRFLPTPGASYQDTSFIFKSYVTAKKMKIIDEYLHHYRIHPQSSSFQNNNKMFCICEEYDVIWEYLENNQLSQSEMMITLLLQFKAYLWNYEHLDKPHQKIFLKKMEQDLHTRFKILMKNSNFKDKFKLVLLKTILVHSFKFDYVKWATKLSSNKISNKLLKQLLG